MASNNHSNGRRAEPPMSARQGALILKYLERIDARGRVADRVARAQREKIIKGVHRLTELLERRSA